MSYAVDGRLVFACGPVVADEVVREERAALVALRVTVTGETGVLGPYVIDHG